MAGDLGIQRTLDFYCRLQAFEKAVLGMVNKKGCDREACAEEFGDWLEWACAECELKGR